MKGLLCGALLSHRSAVARELDSQGAKRPENRVTRFPEGREGGAVRHQRGESHRRWLITVMLFMPYDTESQSRNVLASPLGEEGHEVAKGVQANWIHRGAPRPANPVRRHPAKSVCTRVRMIMILDVDVTAERRHYNTHRPQGNPKPSGQSPVNPHTEGVSKAGPS